MLGPLYDEEERLTFHPKEKADLLGRFGNKLARKNGKNEPIPIGRDKEKNKGKIAERL